MHGSSPGRSHGLSSAVVGSGVQGGASNVGLCPPATPLPGQTGNHESLSDNKPNGWISHKGRRVCDFFSKYGNCRQQDSCKFLHLTAGQIGAANSSASAQLGGSNGIGDRGAHHMAEQDTALRFSQQPNPERTHHTQGQGLIITSFDGQIRQVHDVMDSSTSSDPQFPGHSRNIGGPSAGSAWSQWGSQQDELNTGRQRSREPEESRNDLGSQSWLGSSNCNGSSSSSSVGSTTRDWQAFGGGSSGPNGWQGSGFSGIGVWNASGNGWHGGNGTNGVGSPPMGSPASAVAESPPVKVEEFWTTSVDGVRWLVKGDGWAYTENQRRRVCDFYCKKGNCRHGIACQFLHIPPESFQQSGYSPPQVRESPENFSQQPSGGSLHAGYVDPDSPRTQARSEGWHAAQPIPIRPAPSSVFGSSNDPPYYPSHQIGLPGVNRDGAMPLNTSERPAGRISPGNSGQGRMSPGRMSPGTNGMPYPNPAVQQMMSQTSYFGQWNVSSLTEYLHKHAKERNGEDSSSSL